jgi:hypothetical protein
VRATRETRQLSPRKHDKKSPSPITETETETGVGADIAIQTEVPNEEIMTMTTTKTTSNPSSPRLEHTPLVADEAPLGDERSTHHFQEDARPESSHDAASAVVVNGERPRTARSMSKKLIKRQRSQVQYEKPINPLWGWTRIGSSRSTASTQSA